MHKHAETKNWKQPDTTPRRRAKPPPSDTLRPSRRFSPPPPAPSSGSEGVFVDSLTNTTKTDAAVATKTSGTDRDGRGGTPRPTEPSSSQRRSQQSSRLDTPPAESTNDDTGSMDIQNGEADEAAPPSCGEDISTWSFGDYSESDQSLDSAFDWLPGEEHFVRRLHDQHPLLAQTEAALKRIFTEYRIYLAADRAGGSTIPSRQAPSVADSYAASTTGARKRQRPGHGGPRRNPDDGDDDEKYLQSPPAARDDPSGEEKGPPFACPYFKKDSMVHQSCYQFTLRRIRDVKQHVGRKHSMPIYCPICNDIFPKEQERDNHVRENRCPQKPFAKPEGTTEEQKKKLGKRAPANQTREEQWYGIFYTLFDVNVARPLSPYLQIDGVLFHGALNLQQYIVGEGVQVLDTFLAEHNAMTWNIPYDEEDAASFRRHILEQAVRHMFQSWEARSAPPPTPSILESRPATSEPTQGSSDIYPVTPSSIASQAGTSYSTPQNMPQLALRPPMNSSSTPQSFGFPPHPSSNPDFTSAPDFTSTGQDYGNVVFADELQDIFGMTALSLENGLMNDMNFDAASFYTSTSASEAGQNMNFFNFQ